MKKELTDLLKIEGQLKRDIHKDYEVFRLKSIGMIQAHSNKLTQLSERIRIRCRKVIIQIDNCFLSDEFQPQRDREALEQMKLETMFHRESTIKAMVLETKGRTLQSNEKGNMVILSRLDTDDMGIIQGLLRSHYGKSRDRIIIPEAQLAQLKKKFLMPEPSWAELYKELDQLRRLYKEIEKVEVPNFLNVTLNMENE